MKRTRLLGMAVCVLTLVALVLIFRGRIHFNLRSFGAELRHVSVWHVAAGIGLIYGCYVLRAMRWALFLRPQKKVHAVTLLGAQVIGFTAVGLFGRLADLARPYLVAKRTRLTVSSQIAVYTVERMFDLGSAALVFSAGLAFAARGAMPHAEAMAKIGRGSLLGTMVLGAAVVMLRTMGERVARLAQKIFGVISENLGASVAEKIRGFRDGLRVVTSFGEFVYATVLSVLMWGVIALAYVQAVHAFVDMPALAQMTFAQTMVLMASSVAGSVVQLPVVGWFSQIGVTAVAMTTIFGVPAETATACGGVIFLVCSLSVIPVGLVYARVEGISLKKVAEASKAAESA